MYSIQSPPRAPQCHGWGASGSQWGEAEGGLAALTVAELERDIRDPDYLGSIAISGIADGKQLYEQIVEESSPGRFVFLAYGVRTLYPRFQVNQVLTEKGLALYHQIETACTLQSPGPGIPANRTIKPDWKDNGFVQRFFARNSVGQIPAYGPLLVIGSDADPAVSKGLTAQVVARLCKQRDVVQFHKYRSTEFARVLGDSVRDQLTWIQARFAGRPASSDCH
jgi:hypothetical protein